jgi:hypothetical protein
VRTAALPSRLMRTEQALAVPLDLSRTVFLVGAGISIDPPSNVPAAAQLLDVLGEWVCGDDGNLRRAYDAALTPPAHRAPYEGPYATARFELLLEWARFFEPAIYDALTTLDDAGEPNLWHLYVALAMRDGAVVLTTNFDTRIEHACLRLGVPLRSVVVTGSRLSSDALQAANLIKLHGSFAPGPGVPRHAKPVGTLSQISRFGIGYGRSDPLVTRVHGLLEERTAVVCGYSGWDSFDVMPLLETTARKGSLIWHRWRPGRGGRISRPAVFDPLLDLRPVHTPVDVFLAEAASTQPGQVHAATGATDWFFRTLWPPGLVRHAHRAVRPVGHTAGPDEALRKLRECLAEEGFRLGRESAEALLGQLAFPYNSDDYKEAPEPYPLSENAAKRDDGAPPDAFTDRVVRLMERHEFVSTAEAFERYIATIEACETDVHPLTYGDALILGVSLPFWNALKLGQRRQASRIVSKVRRIARRRGLLWALVLADYMGANVAVDRAAAALRQGHHGAVPKLNADAVVLLDRAMRYALRIPRLDIFVDALRLRVGIEQDPAARMRLERGLVTWADRLPPCEERALAYADCLRHHVARGDPRRPTALLRRLYRVLASRPLKSAAAFRASARCTAALYAEGPAALRRAATAFEQTLSDLPQLADTAWRAEAEAFVGMADRWLAGEPPLYERTRCRQTDVPVAGSRSRLDFW